LSSFLSLCFLAALAAFNPFSADSSASLPFLDSGVGAAFYSLPFYLDRAFNNCWNLSEGSTPGSSESELEGKGEGAKSVAAFCGG
jgi:hypothetical protein